MRASTDVFDPLSQLILDKSELADWLRFDGNSSLIARIALYIRQSIEEVSTFMPDKDGQCYFVFKRNLVIFDKL